MKAIVRFFNFLLGYVVRFLAVIATRLLYRPKVLYVNKKKQGKYLRQPTIVISNHIYFIDGAIIGTVFGRNRIYTLAAKDLYRKKILGWLLNHVRGIPVDRGNATITWLYRSVNVLKRGYSLCMFPEGVSSHNGRMRSFKSGFAKVAIEAEVPVLMVCIDGLYNPIFGPRQWVLIDDKPFYIKPPEGGVTSEFLAEITKEIEEKMRLMQKKLKELRYGKSSDASEELQEEVSENLREADTNKTEE